MELNQEADGVALVCEGKILDYLAWGRGVVGPSGSLHSAAVKARMWSDVKDFVDTAQVDFGSGYTSPGLQKGDSLGRDKDSTDTNNPKDWTAPGGIHARATTPGSWNVHHVTLPLINEVMFLPNPESSDLREIRKFVEIYRADPTYSLNGCTLVNDGGGTFRVDFGDDFDLVHNEYVSIKHSSGLSSKYRLNRRHGILWAREMASKGIDGLALFCDGNLIDYVAWGRNLVGPNGTLHNTAVANDMWNSTGDFVETGTVGGINGFRMRGVQPGDSIGRDQDSKDTNGVSDWAGLGGISSTGPTPGRQNLDPFVTFLDTPYEGDDNGLRMLQTDKKRDLTVMHFVVNHYDDKGFYKNPESMSDLTGDAARVLQGIMRNVMPAKVNFVAQYGESRLYFSDAGAIKSNVNNWRPDKAETLQEFIVWAKATFPADKYILHMSGHGAGWKGMNVAIGSDKNTRALTMADMRKALGKFGEKIDVIFLDSCLMGGLEVAYQIRDQAEYVTFSEEVMYAGIDWSRLTKRIISNRKKSAKFLATLLAKEYRRSIRARHKDYTISVVELAKVYSVRRAVDTFAGALTIDMDNVEEHDKRDDNLNVVWAEDILKKAKDFLWEDYVDLSDLAKLTKDSAADFLAKLYAPNVIDAVKKAVVVSYPGTTEAATHTKAKGMHIYHPRSLMQDFEKQSQVTVDRAYDNTWPSKALYALDEQSRVPEHVHEKNHSSPIDPGFLFPKDSAWDEFLIRFYKPTADACIRTSETKCVREADVALDETVTISGKGSSDADPWSAVGTKAPTGHWYLKYFWDTDLETDNPKEKPKYKEAVKYFGCVEDCDRDDEDTKFDDPDKIAEEWPFTCNSTNAGKTFDFQLHVWDDHNLWEREWEENRNYNRGRHWLHFQVDTATVKLHCESEENTTSTTTSTKMTSTTESTTPSTTTTVNEGITTTKTTTEDTTTLPTPTPTPVPTTQAPETTTTTTEDSDTTTSTTTQTTVVTPSTSKPTEPPVITTMMSMSMMTTTQDPGIVTTTTTQATVVTPPTPTLTEPPVTTMMSMSMTTEVPGTLTTSTKAPYTTMPVTTHTPSEAPYSSPTWSPTKPPSGPPSSLGAIP